jgi:hypothetical protein
VATAARTIRLIRQRCRATNTAEDEFFEMADAVNSMAVNSPRDVPAWQEAVRSLGEVSDARSERILLVTLRMPTLLKALLYVATVALIGGMAPLGLRRHCAPPTSGIPKLHAVGFGPAP